MTTSTAAIGKNGYKFGQGGYAAYGRIELPGMAKKESEEEKYRKGIVYFFGNLTCSPPLSKMDCIADGLKADGPLYKAITALSTIKDVAVNGLPASMQTVADAIQKQLTNLEEPGSNPVKKFAAEASKSAAAEVSKHIPGVVHAMFSEIGKIGVPVLGDLVTCAKEFANAIKLAITVYSTQDVYAALRKGEPTVIIKQLHETLTEDAVASLVKGLYAGAKSIAASLTSGVSLAVTKVVDIIASVLAFIVSVYNYYKEKKLLESFFEACKEIFETNGRQLSSSSAFCDWFTPWLSQLPIIASYCIACPMTGSYYGLLTTATNVSDEALKLAGSSITKLKVPAINYVRAYKVRIGAVPGNKLVEMSVKIIQKGGVDLTDGAAAKSVSIWRKGLMKIGLMKNTLF